MREDSGTPNSPDVLRAPDFPCRECAAGNHVYCLDDGSSTVDCDCPCGDENMDAAAKELYRQVDEFLGGRK